MSAVVLRTLNHLRLRRAIVLVIATALLCATAVAASGSAAAAPTDGPDPLGAPARYHAMTPQRLLDTRAGGTPIGPGQTRLLDFGSRIAPAIEAVVVNITTVDATADGYLTLYPHGRPRPTVSNVRHPTGAARSTSVTVTVTNQGPGRLVDLYNNVGSVDYVVDLSGYYIADPVPGGDNPSSYFPRATAVRVYDSRSGGGAPFGNGESRTVVVTPEASTLSVRAVAVNLTVVTPTGPGYVQAWSGTGAPPLVSSVNFRAGRTTPNFAIVPVRCAPGTECLKSAISIRNVSSSAHVVVDVLGVYAASGPSSGTRFVSVTPYRVLDTRSAPPGRLGPGGTVVALVGDGGSTGAVAANMTVTAVGPTLTTYLQTYRDGAPVPTTSTVNALPGEVVANATQTAVTDDFTGAFRVRNSAGSVHVVVDVFGWFLPE